MIKKYLFKKWPFKDKSIYPGLTKKNGVITLKLVWHK